MFRKILITLYDSDIAPRFDLTTEVLIVAGFGDTGPEDKRVVILPRASADQLCHLIITEKVQVVICGGIVEDYYQYLIWKRIKVIDSVIGSSEAALKRFKEGKLKPGEIL